MIKLAIFGAGRMGHIHAQNLASRHDACLTAIVDPRRDAASELAGRYGANVLDTETVLEDPGIDAVIIASAAEAHAEQISAAAQAGKAIFCEKPIARELEKVRQAVEAVERSGVPFMLGFNRRFDPSFDALKTYVCSQDAGAIELVLLTSRDPSPPPIEYIAACGGIIKETSIHDIDMARWLTGEEPISVYAQGAARSDPRLAEAGFLDTVVITLQMPSGALVTINNSWRATYGYDQRAEIHCAGGMAQLGNMAPNSVTIGTGVGFTTPKPVAFFTERYADAYRREINHFITQLHAGQPMSVNARDGLRALEIADAAMTSIGSGQAVHFRADR